MNLLRATSGNAIELALKDLDEFPEQLVLAELRDRFTESKGQEKLNLAYGLAHLDQVEIDTLINGLINPDTEPEEMDNILTALQTNESESLKKLQAAAKDASSQSDWPVKIRLAIVALHLGDSLLAADMLRDQPELDGKQFNPIERTVFIREFGQWSGRLEPLAEIVSATDNSALRSGICLALGSVKKPSQEAKEAWRPILQRWYSTATDSGTHSSARLALSRWNLEMPEIVASKEEPSDCDWWHGPHGIRFVKIEAGSVTGVEGLIQVQDDFWLGDSEITVGLFRQFMADEEYHKKHPELKKPDWEGPRIFNNDSDDLPVQQVSWYDSVMFCNWLSEELGLDPCYDVKKKGAQDYDVKWQRDADGIRLPTEGEWEYACRAATTTRFSFGDDDQDLVDYGWYASNSNSWTHLIRTKLCSAWGLFDMHGNVDEWCWSEGSYRMHRGGSWYDPARSCQSSRGSRNEPTGRGNVLGFRVARGPSSPAIPASE